MLNVRMVCLNQLHRVCQFSVQRLVNKVVLLELSVVMAYFCFVPFNGLVLNSAAIADGTVEALVNSNDIYSFISHLPMSRVTSVTCNLYVGHLSC